MTALQPHRKAKALKPSSRRPAKELCSECGLCDTYYIHYVKDACAFIHQQIAELEAEIHDRSRDLDNPDELYFGVHQTMMAARKTEPIAGAQWTGIVSSIAIEMLNRGLVEGVVCVQNTEDDRFQPKPVIARTARRNPGGAGQQADLIAQPVGAGADRAVGHEAAAGDWGRLPDPGAAGDRKATGTGKALRPGYALRR